MNHASTQESAATPAARQAHRFDLAARALDAQAVRPSPARPAAYAKWAAALAQQAARDEAMLARVPLEDGSLSSEELLGLAPLVEYAAANQRQLDALRTRTARLTPQDALFLKGIRADQRAVLRAFRMLRFRGNRIGLALVRSISRGDADDARDALQDNYELLALCNSVDHEWWLRRLPGGEHAASQRLWEKHNDLLELASRSPENEALGDAREHAHRLWTLVHGALARVRTAGRYLAVGDRGRREAYARFRAGTGAPAKTPAKKSTTKPAKAPVKAPAKSKAKPKGRSKGK